MRVMAVVCAPWSCGTEKYPLDPQEAALHMLPDGGRGAADDDGGADEGLA